MSLTLPFFRRKTTVLESHGDYILLGNRNFIVADVTYIGVSAGMIMPEMDNRLAKVILQVKLHGRDEMADVGVFF